MDGVLADVSRSYRAAIVATADSYLREVLGAPASTPFFTPEHTDALKRAGGFNNDWDAAAGLVLAAVSRHGQMPAPVVSPDASAAEAVAAVAGALHGIT